MQALFNNNVFFKNKKSLQGYDGSDLTNMGYDREDGLPQEML